MNAPFEPMQAPPHSVAAEQSVLGGLLLDNGAWDRIGDSLKESHFYRYDHRLIFQHITKLINSCRPADVITVYEALLAAAKAEEVGGLGYLNELAQNTPSAANIGHYAEIVRDKAARREIITLCREIDEMAYASPDDAPAIVDALTSRLERMAHSTVKNEPSLACDTLVRHIESIDARYHGNGEAIAISTGWVDLDRKLNGGLRPGNLIIVAGRPKMGKTSFALNIANAVSENGVAAVLSMEMTITEIHDRNIAHIGGIHLDHLIDPKQMTDEDWNRLTHAVQKISQRRLYLDDQSALTLMDVRCKAKMIKRKAGLDVIVIDYLQLMSAPGDNRNAQIESITRGLKNLAKELNIAIILLSQLNRKVEDRPNKRPTPADLRDSGAIEQDCDICIFLYRDEVYNLDTMDKGVCEIDIALNRQGAAGRVALAYVGENTSFKDLHRDWHPAPPKKAPTRSRGMSDD